MGRDLNMGQGYGKHLVGGITKLATGECAGAARVIPSPLPRPINSIYCT